MDFLHIGIKLYCNIHIAINWYCNLHIAINWYCKVKTNIPSNATAAQTSSIWLREGFKQYDGDSNQVPRWMAISKCSEKDSNNVMAIQMEFPGGWQFWSPRRRIRTMWWQFELSSQVDCNFKALREGFEQCNGNLNQVHRWMANLKRSEKDSNNVTVIWMKFLSGWQFWSHWRRIL